MTEHLTTEEMENHADIKSRRNMPSGMLKHLRSCETCYQSYVDIRFKRRKFPIVIDLDELAGFGDRRRQDEDF